jgi:AraC family transcriptional regulator
VEPKLLPGDFFGRILRRRSVAGLTVTETQYPPRLKLPPHRHAGAYFCLVLQGSYTETSATRSQACGPATLLFHPPYTAHADELHQTTVRCCNVELDDGWLARVRAHAELPGHSVAIPGGPASQLALRLYREVRAPDALSALTIEGLALELLAESFRPPSNGEPREVPPWLARARAMLHDRFRDPVGLGALAEAVGVHPVHLAREFRRRFRCTVGDYVRRLRIDLARRRLAASDAPLAEVKAAAGFFDQSHFTRTFKRLTGMTPGQHRALFRSG